MTLETLIASLGVIGALQAAYLYARNMEVRPVEGRATWSDESDFQVESDESRMERKLRKDFDIARAKAIMAMAAEFAGPKKA